jgi:RimJ/RimL family protein N-acetyltransferase
MKIQNYKFKLHSKKIKSLFSSIYPEELTIPERMSYNEKSCKSHVSTKIAFMGKKIIGQANIFLLKDKKDIANLGYHIHPDFQRKGIGKKLALEAMKEAKRKKIRLIIVQTKKVNKSSRALAKRLGFVRPSKENLKEIKKLKKKDSRLVCLCKELR